MNEAETRAEHIDPALKAAGWGVVEGSRIRREYRITEGRIQGHGKRGKADIADYILEYRVLTAWRAATSTDMVPPLPCMMRSSRRYPCRERSPASVRR